MHILYDSILLFWLYFVSVCVSMCFYVSTINILSAFELLRIVLYSHLFIFFRDENPYFTVVIHICTVSVYYTDSLLLKNNKLLYTKSKTIKKKKPVFIELKNLCAILSARWALLFKFSKVFYDPKLLSYVQTYKM